MVRHRRAVPPSERAKFPCSLEMVEIELARFLRATENICSIFFAIVMEEAYLSLNS